LGPTVTNVMSVKGELRVQQQMFRL